VLATGRDCASEIERRAAAAGLPSALWSTLAVEGTRASTLVSAVQGLPAAAVHHSLSAAAAEARQAPRSSRLNDYARALRAAAPRPPATTMGRVVLRPGLLSATAWEAEANNGGVALEIWARQAILAAPDGFVGWEAAAADEGRSLVEWALVYAARRRRSTSTPAHMAG
jgi:hypothetical protein